MFVMDIITVKAKKWGNSVGIILPKDLQIEPDEEIRVQIMKTNERPPAKVAWGIMKKKFDTQKVLDEIDADEDPV